MSTFRIGNHVFHLQVVEYDTPEKLLLTERGAFSRMVQSTGATNAQYLRGLVFGEEGDNKIKREPMHINGEWKWMVSSSWTSAAQFAVSLNLASALKDLQVVEFEDSNNILNKTRAAVVTLQGILEGKEDEAIEETLNHYMVPRERWWSALYRIIEGLYLLITPIATNQKQWSFLFGKPVTRESSTKDKRAQGCMRH